MDLTRIAADAFRTPMALVTFPDHERNRFKSRIGMKATEAPRAHALCEHLTLRPGELMVVFGVRRQRMAGSSYKPGPEYRKN